MRHTRLKHLAAVGACGALLGGLVARPAIRWAAERAAQGVEEHLVSRLEARLGAEIQFDSLNLGRDGRYSITGVRVNRPNAFFLRVKKVSGSWSLLAVLGANPSRAVTSVHLEGVELAASKLPSRLGGPLELYRGRASLNRYSDGWRVDASLMARLGDGPRRAVTISGDTGGVLNVSIPEGFPLVVPGRAGLGANVRAVTLAYSEQAAIVTALDLVGLPEGLSVSLDSVAVSRSTDGGGRSDRSKWSVVANGLVVEVDLDKTSPSALASSLGMQPGATGGGGDSGAMSPSGTPGLGDWSIVAEEASVTVVRDGKRHSIPSARLQLNSDGTVEVAVARQGDVFEGDIGARLIPISGPSATGGVRVAFDVWVDNGRITHPKLAATPLEDIRGRALGVVRWLPDIDRVEVDIRKANIGSARVAGRFVGEHLSNRRKARVGLALDVPDQPCQALIGGFPTGTLSLLGDMKLDGRFEGGVEFAVDMANIEETLILEARGDPASCRIDTLGDAVDLAALNRRDFVHRWDRIRPRGKSTTVNVGPGTKGYVRYGRLPKHVIRSMIVTEDGRFWRHNGVNLKLVKKALRINLKKGGFTYGGSTITQQLMKNLFLTRDKTLARKAEEVLLALAVERVVSKRRLMELYVNVIEFGPDVYGITRGARYYFGKSATQLTPIEGAFLATIKPKPNAGPKLARRGRFKGWWHHRLIEVMGWLEEGGYITPLERARAFPYYPRFRGPVLSRRAEARRPGKESERRPQLPTPPADAVASASPRPDSSGSASDRLAAFVAKLRAP